MIPEIFHMIWVGGCWPPDKIRLLDRFHALGMYPQKHGDEEYASSRTAKLLASRPELPYAVVADFWRVELLIEHGGVYLDADSLVLRHLGPFAGDRAPWIATSVSAADQSGFVSNAFMGFPAGHPFLLELWERAERALQYGASHAFQLAGPTQVRRTLANHPDVEVVHEAFRNSTPTSLMQAQQQSLRFLAKYPGTYVLHLSEKSWQ